MAEIRRMLLEHFAQAAITVEHSLNVSRYDEGTARTAWGVRIVRHLIRESRKGTSLNLRDCTGRLVLDRPSWYRRGQQIDHTCHGSRAG